MTGGETTLMTGTNIGEITLEDALNETDARGRFAFGQIAW